MEEKKDILKPEEIDELIRILENDCQESINPDKQRHDKENF
jgi:hypothetical protein